MASSRCSSIRTAGVKYRSSLKQVKLLSASVVVERFKVPAAPAPPTGKLTLPATTTGCTAGVIREAEALLDRTLSLAARQRLVYHKRKSAVQRGPDQVGEFGPEVKRIQGFWAENKSG